MSNTKRKVLDEKTIQQMVEFYLETKSVFQTSKVFSVGINRTRRLLKEKNVLLSLSDLAKLRVGPKNPFYGKKHSEENKKKHSEYMSTKLGKLNPNYRHGNYKRRPRDFKIAQFKPVRNEAFKRDNYTCQFTGQVGGYLHAHHLIPFWVCENAYFDVENLITVSNKAHFEICHLGDWAKFNADIVPDSLLQKYNIDRERLNELARLYNSRDVIVRPSAIHKTEETSRNDLSRQNGE